MDKYQLPVPIPCKIRHPEAPTREEGIEVVITHIIDGEFYGHDADGHEWSGLDVERLEPIVHMADWFQAIADSFFPAAAGAPETFE